MSTDGPLACPRCANRFSLEERFCPECEMPLVYAGGGEQGPITDAHGRARKVRPQFARGELVKVAWARNQAEAELISGLLLEEGIPSMARRSPGFDVPDFLAAGPRDILVAESGVEAARRLLTESDLDTAERELMLERSASPAPVRLLAGILVALILGAGLLALAVTLAG